jgi:hypothetical protein
VRLDERQKRSAARRLNDYNRRTARRGALSRKCDAKESDAGCRHVGGRNAMFKSKIVSGTCHKSMWHTSACHAASMSAARTGETGAETNAAPQAGAARFMSMQIVEGDADFGADPMLAIIGRVVDLKAPRTGRRSGQEQTGLTRIFN